MKYTIQQFNKDYPNDNVCLETILHNRYGDLTTCPFCGVIGTKFYKVRNRKCFECKDCGHQVYPLAGTIFHKSETSLLKWFFAIYLFSVSKNGVSAKELERALGVTYKTAWRMAKQIRLLMQQDRDRLSGEVEIDETYIGGKPQNRSKSKRDKDYPKQVLFGMASRDGKAKVKHVVSSGSRSLIPQVITLVEEGSQIYSDEYTAYKVLPKYGFKHESINHSLQEYICQNVHTNTIEGF